MTSSGFRKRLCEIQKSDFHKAIRIQVRITEVEKSLNSPNSTYTHEKGFKIDLLWMGYGKCSNANVMSRQFYRTG